MPLSLYFPVLLLGTRSREIKALGTALKGLEVLEVEPGGGVTPLFGLYRDVLLDRVWFFGLAVLNRVYNLTWLCPEEGQNLS